MPTSVPVQPTITEAGLAAIFNAQSTGVEFALTHIAFGTAQYVPDGTETALQAEKVRVPIAGGGRISPTQIQIYAIAQAVAGSPFFVGELGFFGDDGTTLLAVYSSTATPNLFLSDTVSTSVSYALGLAALPASSVTVTIDPSASAALLLIGQHVAAADPHPQYVEKVNGVAFYDPTLAFDLGAQIIGDDLLVYQSVQANNIDNLPSTSPTWWVPLYNYGDTPVSGLTNATVTLTSTQAARAHITLTGALTAALNIVFPNWVKDWTVVNATTGAFAVTCKTAAGTGVVIPQNGSPTRIRGDGANITQAPENVAPAAASQHAVQLQQVGSRSGEVCFFAVNAPPTGFLAANGAAVSRTTYATLFSTIGTTFGSGDGSTTFNVPDMRGYFPRGWDNGAGVDPGRTFGSTQADGFASHNHGVTDPQHTHTYSASNGAGGGTFLLGSPNQAPGTATTNAASTGITIQSTGGTETRPKNVALLACIKY
jgi:microcystin-dependent protein